jgi:5-methyltetrahydropteroyltriglutamate--homocysteine methyltransferase
MISSRDRILTTHVGSLPRNVTLSELLVRREAGESVALTCAVVSSPAGR